MKPRRHPAGRSASVDAAGHVTISDAGDLGDHLGDNRPENAENVTALERLAPKSVAQRVAAHRARKAGRHAATLSWEREDWRFFTNARTLPQKAGCQPSLAWNAAEAAVIEQLLAA
jgi:hypothetical protein